MKAKKLMNRIDKLCTTASSLTTEAGERIDELEREIRYLKAQLKLGRGHIVDALTRANDKAFAAEVELSEFELFDKLRPLIWPHCLLWMHRIEPTAANTLRGYIEGRGSGKSHPTDINNDIETLERIKTLIEDTIKGLK
jgi:hypothetical protein